ncbi:glycerol kinase GlpK [Aquabacterium sp. UBA2148]|uniref:glycerol kinase GlpK n=1 Tax=Aquabacterium sp. UBA2148 TaxID=1946042 RepID=UPI00257A6F64|nr:glycerol kinase GlpK [Aquabacterium sp. UBA2148]
MNTTSTTTPTYLLALDQGTSSSRSILFTPEGQIAAMAQRELPQVYPQPGWVEHDARTIWRIQLETAREVLAQVGATPQQVRAIGITNQRETTVVWSRRTGEPIHHAIVWQDRRTEAFCAELRAGQHDARCGGSAEALVQQRTGLRTDAYFSATKLRWILDQVPGAREAAERGELAFGTIDSWLIWQLTEGREHLTDASNASRTMLFNIHTGQWDDDLLRLFDIPRAVLPEVRPSSSEFGHTTLLGGQLPIGGVAGDQQASLFGQACFRPGLAKNTYGTGCFMLMHTGDQAQASQNGLLTTAAAQPDARHAYALEGSVFIGGAVVQWLRDGLQAIRASGEVQQLAESVPDAGGVVFVPAFTGLGAPYWAGDARGAILGLTRGSTVAHIARAALESIAFQSAALLQAMSRDAVAHGGSPVSELRVDGGACANDLLMQIQADLLGIPVVRPKVIETTALGAAYLAGLATGVYRNLSELEAQWQVDRRFLPTLSRAEAAARMARWEHAVRQTLAA